MQIYKINMNFTMTEMNIFPFEDKIERIEEFSRVEAVPYLRRFKTEELVTL